MNLEGFCAQSPCESLQNLSKEKLEVYTADG